MEYLVADREKHERECGALEELNLHCRVEKGSVGQHRQAAKVVDPRLGKEPRER